MKSFKNPKFLERYEDVVFDLEQPLETAPANNSYQTRKILNSSLITPVKLLYLIGITQECQWILKRKN